MIFEYHELASGELRQRKPEVWQWFNCGRRQNHLLLVLAEEGEALELHPVGRPRAACGVVNRDRNNWVKVNAEGYACLQCNQRFVVAWERNFAELERLFVERASA